MALPLLPQESAATLPARLPTSRKRPGQAALRLGRPEAWMRHVAERLRASQLLLPASPVPDFTAGWHVPRAEPDQQGTATALSFSNPEP